MSPRPVVLVTGAAKRLGKAIAVHLAAQGWDIALHYGRSHAEALACQDEIQNLGAACEIFAADLESPSAIATMLEQIAKRMGSFIALVNSASVFEYDRGVAASPASLQKHMAINLQAPMLLSQALHRQLPAQTMGCVVNLIDQKVFNLNADYFSYTLSKYALEGMTKMLALELAPQTRVCAVAPGITLESGDQTAANFATAHQATPLQKSSAPYDIAQAVAYLLQASAVTGTTLIVDGGQHLYPLKRDIMFTVEDHHKEPA